MNEVVPPGVICMRPLSRGIDVDISSTGNVAQFNFELFIGTVIAGLVFLGTAKTVCDLVATMVRLSLKFECICCAPTQHASLFTHNTYTLGDTLQKVYMNIIS